MLNVQSVRQPKCFDHFRCIGAACEDTCCAGWGIVVDQQTYEKYQSLPARQIAGKDLSALVEFYDARSSSRDYARFRLEEAVCPALEQGVCAIQQTLGEPYIPDLCSTYPRSLTVIGRTLERSLHLSCPEAARLVLNDPDSMVLQERVEEEPLHRSGSVALIADPDDSLHRVRALVIDVIGERSLPLGQRIVSLGFVVDKLAGIDPADAVPILEDHLNYLRQGLFPDDLMAQRGDAAFQLETVLELAIARIGSDYTPPRFVKCFSDFLVGLEWTADTSMEELAARYDSSSERYFLPFVRRHEHLLENYLIGYIFRTAFPYRSKLPDRKFSIDSRAESLRNSFILLAVHYAMIRTFFIGMAAMYKDNLSVDHAVKLVQSYSKAFLHISSFEKSVIEYFVPERAGQAALPAMERAGQAALPVSERTGQAASPAIERVSKIALLVMD